MAVYDNTQFGVCIILYIPSTNEIDKHIQSCHEYDMMKPSPAKPAPHWLKSMYCLVTLGVKKFDFEVSFPEKNSSPPVERGDEPNLETTIISPAHQKLNRTFPTDP